MTQVVPFQPNAPVPWLRMAVGEATAQQRTVFYSKTLENAESALQVSACICFAVPLCMFALQLAGM